MLPFTDESAMSKLTSTPNSDRIDLVPRKLWLSDDDFQSEMLEGVSRTFALTIPQLPAELCRVVSNAYLLCRIVDTIEDEPVLSGAQKNSFCQQFLKTLNVARNAEPFSRQLSASLSSQTPHAEHELIQLGKAGRNRWKRKRPSVRGVAMNPVDHPLGGGEGKSSGGRHPTSPWGQKEGRTRKKNKASNKYIVRRRGKGRG